ncbi:MAG: universal stress protein, partial [Syntrophales bacterium LBB04]|nr:universal stress protein [Syntrophales bacterium LBB04]
IEEHNLPVETMIRFGKVVDEIVKSVHETGFDMLVLGSHGHHGIGDLVYGQTVESVRHAVKIPVVVVRTQGMEQAQRNG